MERSGAAPGGRPTGFPPRYEDPVLVGRGGMGEVYRARDAVRGTVVALKVLRPDRALDGAARRFDREVVAMAGLVHPHVVRLLDAGETRGTPWLAMEFVDGRSLDRLWQGPASDPERAVELVAQAADGLAAAHAAGLLHRDLKPQNILVSWSGVAKLVDFGLCRATDPAAATRLTRTGYMVGSAAYLAPETVRGEPGDERLDVYQLGLVLYETLTGVNPQADLDLCSLGRRAYEVPPPSKLAHGLDPRLDALVLEAMAWEPARRPATAALVRDRLVAWLRDGGRGPEPRRATCSDAVRPLRSSVDTLAPSRPRRSSAAAALGFLLGVLVVGGGLWCRRAPSAVAAPARFSVAARGAGAVLVSVPWGSGAAEPCVAVRRAVDGAPVACRLEPCGLADGDGPTRWFVLRGLTPDTDYRAGAGGQERPFRTLTERPLELSVVPSVDVRGALVLRVRAAAPCRVSAVPAPERRVALDPPGAAAPWSCAWELSLSAAVAATAPAVSLAFESLDGGRVARQVEPRALLARELDAVWREFLVEHRSGSFHRALGCGTTSDQPLLMRAAVEAARGPAPWQEFEAAMARECGWWRRLAPHLPGVSALRSAPWVDAGLRASVALALAPLELLASCAARTGLPPNPAWSAALDLEGRPYRVEGRDGVLDKFRAGFAWGGPPPGAATVLILADLRNPWVRQSVTDDMLTVVPAQVVAEVVLDRDPQTFRRAAVRVGTRTAGAQSLYVVDVNDGAFVATMVHPSRDWRAFLRWMRSASGLSGAGPLAFRRFGAGILGPRAALDGDYAARLASLCDLAGPKEQFSIWHELPPSCLRQGANVLRVSCVTGPVEPDCLPYLVGLGLALGD